MHSPLVPVPVFLNSQGHFPNILLSEKENILSLFLSLKIRDIFDKLSILSLVFSSLRVRDIFDYFVCVLRDIFDRHIRS